MYEILLKILDSTGQFLLMHFTAIIWFFILIYVIRVVKKNKEAQMWVINQFEWIKLFFVEDKGPHTPSHKNLIGLALAAVFCIAYLKKVVGATDVPDIPSGWQLVLLGILGIRAIQSAVENVADKKYLSETDADKKVIPPVSSDQIPNLPS